MQQGGAASAQDNDSGATPERLGAFVERARIHLRGHPGGPLAGLTFAAKDLYDVAGVTTGAGSPEYLATHAPATRHAPAVAALLDAGATLIGKTQTDELAFSLNGENHHYGTPINPAAPLRVPGGSSSGSASAVAGGLVDFALGTDTGGSVRVPASHQGIYGIRTSHGAISLAGIVPLAPSFDVVGWFAREPELMARVGEVLLPPAKPIPARRLLVADDAFALAEPDVRASLMAALKEIAPALGPVHHLRLAHEGLEAWLDCFRKLQTAEAWASHGHWIERAKPDLGLGVRERFLAGSRLTEADLAPALAGRERVRARLAQIMEPGDVLCLPSAADIAPLKGSSGETLERFRTRTLSLTSTAGLCGLPQISLPLGRARSVPVGLSLVGVGGADRALLDLARRFGPNVAARGA
ncbi:MAG: amidase [Proteobacteria bacterium]|nr:amidase [Pseudomonadota bacterium]MBI3498658.1 amidase [Pseudomonadota bacterium]